MNSAPMVTSGTRVKLVNQALRPPLRLQPLVFSFLKHLGSDLGVWSVNLQAVNFSSFGRQSEVAHQGLGEYMLPANIDIKFVKG